MPGQKRIPWGSELSALTEGEGPGLLWIHGYTMGPELWRPLWQALPGWRHVGVCLPGHGQSRALSDRDDYACIAREIAEPAIAAGIRHVVALSFGSIVALQMAIDHRDAFDALVLGSPSLAGQDDDPRVRRVYERLFRIAAVAGPEELAAHWMSEDCPIFDGARRYPDLMATLARVIGAHCWDELRGHAMESLSGWLQRPRDLKRISAQLLLVVGEHDMMAHRRAAEIIRRSAPRAKRVYLDAGHLCLLECPEESVAEIAAFLPPPGDTFRSNPALSR